MTVHLPPAHPLASGRTATSPLISALRGTRPQRTPVWFMRQAGRSLPEYREARKGITMLDACLQPDLAAKITLQPVRRHGVDAGIFFSDIVVPLRLAGVEVDITPGVGPVMDQAYRTRADIDRLTALRLEDDALRPITEAVSRCIAGLGDTPLIGFAGAPFTLAAYLVEGRPSRDHLGARRLMRADPEAWNALVEWAADITGAFLRAQIVAGASAGQLFDSWVGSLSLQSYVDGVRDASTRALSHVADLGVPVIHFGTGTGHLLPAMLEAVTRAGISDAAIGVDHRTPLTEAITTLGSGTVVQGNIDPAVLACGPDVVEHEVVGVMENGAGAAGHVVNLGHGVPPDTDPDVLTRIVDLVHARS